MTTNNNNIEEQKSTVEITTDANGRITMWFPDADPPSLFTTHIENESVYIIEKKGKKSKNLEWVLVQKDSENKKHEIAIFEEKSAAAAALKEIAFTLAKIGSDTDDKDDNKQVKEQILPVNTPAEPTKQTDTDPSSKNEENTDENVSASVMLISTIIIISLFAAGIFIGWDYIKPYINMGNDNIATTTIGTVQNIESGQLNPNSIFSQSDYTAPAITDNTPIIETRSSSASHYDAFGLNRDIIADSTGMGSTIEEPDEIDIFTDGITPNFNNITPDFGGQP